jgi:glucose/arabinose dehydrogenase
VNDNGDIYVILRRGSRPSPSEPFAPGGIVGLRDTNGDGKADVTEKFGEIGGTGLELRNGYLYYAAVTHIGRFKLTPGQLKPAGPAEIVVEGFPTGGGHAEKDITFDNAGNIYVNIGCRRMRARCRIGGPALPGSTRVPPPGVIAADLAVAQVAGQKFSKEARFAQACGSLSRWRGTKGTSMPR